MFKHLQFIAAPAVLGALLTVSPVMAATDGDADDIVKFPMVVSAGAKACLPNAGATVRILPIGPVELMDVSVQGLPPKTEFDFFVIQVPKAPFGVSWYQGDIETDKNGKGHQLFIGRFSVETFTVAPGTAPAPVRHSSPIADASSNPATAPVHQYHLGLWFDSPADATAAGCGSAVTPFNGVHDAGVQVLSTRNFAQLNGPLGRLS